MEEWYHYVLLFGVGLLAAFINTLAGGGSLLNLPVLIFMGLPPSVANGTNRIAVLTQGIANVIGYRSKGMEISSKFIWLLSLSATFGTVIGTGLALWIDERAFNKVLALVMVLMAVLMVYKPQKEFGSGPERLEGQYGRWGVFIFFLIGIYGGFIQAGTGIFMLLALSSVNHMTLMKSNVIKATVTLVYSIAALILFGLEGKLHWEIGLTLASGQALGGWLTSRWSVNKGDGIVKLLMIIMVVAMAIKLWFFN